MTARPHERGTLTREHGMLFADDLVRALLDGRKTQTRRPCLPQPTAGQFDHFCGIAADGAAEWSSPPPVCALRVELRWRCRSPGGVVGDRIWVRECFSTDWPVRTVYRADGRPPYGGDVDAVQRWTPSIHMPRRLARLVFDVTRVRVERVQDISEEDAVAEGARRFDDIPVGSPYLHKFNPAPRWSMGRPETTDQCLGTARFAFGNVWEKAYGARGLGWDANPWVWVYDLRPVAP